MSDRPPTPIFEIMTEIGIINQLGRAALEARTPDGVLVTHFYVINHLIRMGDGTTPIEIAKAFQMPKNSLTHTLAGLETRGWVEMRPNPKDKRSKLVFVTDAGRVFRNETAQKLAMDFSRIIPEITEEEVAIALPFLRKLRALMETNRD